MDERTLNLIYSLITTGFIVGLVAFVIVKIVQANREYEENERRSTIKKDPDHWGDNQKAYERLPYFLKSTVLTNYEKKLYHILAPFCSQNNLILLSKIRMADFVQAYQGRSFYHWFNRISSKHVDFLICQTTSFKPLLAVELDDYTHNYKNRQDRDNFVNSVYFSVGLPVLHITEINSEKIVSDISKILGLNVSTIL